MTITSENGTSPALFDKNKIKISINKIDTVQQSNKKLVPRLRKLTLAEIKADVVGTEQRNDAIGTMKRRSEHGVMTRAKRRKIENMNAEKSNYEEEINHEKKFYDEKNSPSTNMDNVDTTGIATSINQNVNNDVGASPTNNVNIGATCTTLDKPLFAINEVVWGKLRGWPHWPAKVLSIVKRRFEVEWFNDYRRTKLYQSQMFKFVPSNFSVFAEKFPTTVGLEDAAAEAFVYMVKQKKKLR